MTFFRSRQKTQRLSKLEGVIEELRTTGIPKETLDNIFKKRRAISPRYDVLY